MTFKKSLKSTFLLMDNLRYCIWYCSFKGTLNLIMSWTTEEMAETSLSIIDSFFTHCSGTISTSKNCTDGSGDQVSRFDWLPRIVIMYLSLSLDCVATLRRGQAVSPKPPCIHKLPKTSAGGISAHGWCCYWGSMGKISK